MVGLGLWDFRVQGFDFWTLCSVRGNQVGATLGHLKGWDSRRVRVAWVDLEFAVN